MRSRSRGRMLAALLAITTLVAGACGNDDEAATGTATGTGTGTGTGEIDQAAFCDAVIEAESLFLAGPEADEATGEPTPETLQAFSSQIQPHLDTVEANTPPDIETEVQTVLSAVDQALTTGDEAATDSPEFFEAESAIDSYVFDNCELDAQSEVVAVDYAFEDVPPSLSTGRIGLRLDNQGDELHEAVVFRVSDEEDRSIEELLQLPEDEGEQLVEFQGVAFAAPGESSSTVLQLEQPGRYAIVCFVPVGTTSLEQLEGDEGEEAAPHFTQGMFAELTVS